MEPNKLEQEFKRKLDKRTIQPSEMAWDRLDAMLSVAEKKKPKRTWMYIAASFLGFLLVGTIFLKQGKEVNDGGIIKNNDNGVVTLEQPAQINQPAQDTEAVYVMPVQSGEAVVAGTIGTIAQKQDKKAQPVGETAKQEEGIVTAIVKEEAIADNNRAETTKVSPAQEAEMLLAAAGPDVTTKSKKIKVNANSLLSSVENELDESFKKKAFKRALNDIEEVYTSVSNRNYQ